MNIHATTATRDANTAISGAIQQATGNAGLDQQAFLKLLSTQLSNQDPTSPQDQSQMLAQLAQFSTVEGINNMQSSQTHTQAADLLGKTVQASVVVDNQQQSVSGKVSAVNWNSSGVHLTLDDPAQSSITLDQITQVSN